MFDLFRSRAKAVRYVLGALLMMVALSMVVTLIPGFGSGGGDRDDQIVAEVGDEVLTARDVQIRVQNAVRGGQVPNSMLAVMVPEMVDNLITARSVVYEAKRLGLAVSEADVARAIRSFAPMLYQDGKFVGREVYAAYLAQMNFTIPDFEKDIAIQMFITKMQNLVAEGVVVTNDEIERAFKTKNEAAKIEYVSVDPAKFRPQITASAEEIQKYFQENAASFRIKEQRAFQLLVVEEDKIAATINVPEAELRRDYEANKENYRTPERVKVRHILLKTTEKPQDEVPKIRARIEDLLKQIKGGADFAALAKKNSEDTGSAVKGGDLDWVARGQTVKNFEQTAFSLKPKEISGIVQTEYGFHIIQVMEKQDARLKPFEEAREELAKERKKATVYDRMQTLSDQMRAELVKAPLDGEQIARKLGVEFANVPKAGADDPLPLIGASKELEDSLFSLPKGEVTPVVQAPGNRLVVASLIDILPARAGQLSEVEGAVRLALVERKVRQIVDQKARELLEKATANGGDLKQAAQAMGLTWKSVPEFTRTGAVEGLGAGSQVADAFNKPIGSVFGPIPMGELRFVCKVVGRTPPDPAKLAADRELLVAQIRQSKAGERYSLFSEGLRAELVRQGKVKVHQKVIDRLVSSYRSS
jgi:peptidyl-prolyl cis-trans isomerase D